MGLNEEDFGFRVEVMDVCHSEYPVIVRSDLFWMTRRELMLGLHVGGNHMRAARRR